MDILIKNMVCNRCISTVKDIFTSEGVSPAGVLLGRVTVDGNLTNDQLTRIEKRLKEVGFEVLTDQKRKTLEQIKATIAGVLQQDLSASSVNLSELLSTALHRDYSYLSKLFSEMEGITIEKYVIDQKIDRVKELLAYSNRTLNDIAFDMGYSSVAHLSSQFRKVTGFTPSEFRKDHYHQQR